MFYIYSKPGCGFCEKAKTLLSSKDIAFEEKILDVGQEKVGGKTYYTINELKALVPDVRTVPQIFLDTQLIGGYDALKQHLTPATV